MANANPGGNLGWHWQAAPCPSGDGTVSKVVDLFRQLYHSTVVYTAGPGRARSLFLACSGAPSGLVFCWAWQAEGCWASAPGLAQCICLPRYLGTQVSTAV